VGTDWGSIKRLGGVFGTVKQGGGSAYAGVGTVIKKGCQVTPQHNPAARCVTASIQLGTSPAKGTALMQAPPGSVKCMIMDSQLANNSCACTC
jgi:hypothetical protein